MNTHSYQKKDNAKIVASKAQKRKCNTETLRVIKELKEGKGAISKSMSEFRKEMGVIDKFCI
ncbi:MAG: hypothetical protein JWO53_185 [Chlamydiia bacterium]|nr:hypothetical protein [Chlamydiia bacterium]